MGARREEYRTGWLVEECLYTVCMNAVSERIDRTERASRTHLVTTVLVELFVQGCIASIMQRRNQEGDSVHNTQTKRHPVDPTTDDIQSLMPNAGQEGDDVGLTGESDD